MDKYEEFVRWLAKLCIIPHGERAPYVSDLETGSVLDAGDLVWSAVGLVNGTETESTMQGHPPGLGMKF